MYTLSFVFINYRLIVSQFTFARAIATRRFNVANKNCLRARVICDSALRCNPLKMPAGLRIPVPIAESYFHVGIMKKLHRDLLQICPPLKVLACIKCAQLSERRNDARARFA